MSTATALGGLSMMYGMRKAMDEVNEFQTVLYKTKAIAGLTTAEMNDMQQRALDLSYRFPFAATQIAETFLELSKAGIKTKEDMDAMTQATMGFATVADIAIGGEGGSTNMLLNVMAMFGKNISDSKLVAAQLAKAANLTTVSAPQIVESLKYAGPLLKMFNVDMVDAVGEISALAQAGLKGSIAGTSIANSYRFMADAVSAQQSPKQAAALASMGLTSANFQDANGNLKERVELLTMLRDRLKGMGTIPRNQALETIFGVRGAKVSLLMDFLDGKTMEGLPAKTMQEITDQIGKTTGGELDKLVFDRMSQPQQQMFLWNKAMFELKVSMTEVIQTGLIPLLRVLTKVAKVLAAFSHTTLGKIVIGAGVIVIVLGTLAAGIMAMMASLALIRMSGGFTLFAQGGGLFKGIANIFQALKLNLSGVFTFFAKNGAMMSLSAGKWKFIATWGKSLANFFSVGMGAGIARIIGLISPWGRAIAVITVALTVLYNISDKFKGVLDSIGNMFVSVYNWIRGVVNHLTAFLPGNYGQLAQLATRHATGSVTPATRPVAETRSPYFTDPSGKTMMKIDQLIDSITGQKGGDVVVNFVTPDGRVIDTKRINREQQKALNQTLGFKLQ